MAPAKISLALAENLLVQHHQRPAPVGPLVVVVVVLHAAVGVLDLHDRPFVDEQAGQADRLGQRAAAVAAQVEHHGIDALGVEVVEDLAHVAGGALEIGQTLPGACPCPCRSSAGR